MVLSMPLLQALTNRVPCIHADALVAIIHLLDLKLVMNARVGMLIWHRALVHCGKDSEFG